MNVRELIQQLETMDPTMPVWHDGGGDPYCAGEITTVEKFETEGRQMLGHAGETPTSMVMLGL